MWASIIGWLNSVAAVAGPVSIIVGLPGAVIGSIVGVVKVRKWAIHTLVPAQEATQQAADRATSAANTAESAAKDASTHAQSIGKSALELRKANGRLVALLPPKEDAEEYLRETNSRLVAQLVIQASRHPEDFDSPSAPRFAHPSSTDEIYVTGRHAFREEQPPAVEGDS